MWNSIKKFFVRASEEGIQNAKPEAKLTIESFDDSPLNQKKKAKKKEKENGKNLSPREKSFSERKGKEKEK